MIMSTIKIFVMVPEELWRKATVSQRVEESTYKINVRTAVFLLKTLIIA